LTAVAGADKLGVCVQVWIDDWGGRIGGGCIIGGCIIGC
jgi:hypothetical protein